MQANATANAVAGHGFDAGALLMMTAAKAEDDGEEAFHEMLARRGWGPDGAQA